MLRAETSAAVEIFDLPSACTVTNIRDIADGLRSKIKDRLPIVIGGAEVESADVSVVQLIVATAGAVAAPFELRSPAPCLQQAFARAGLGGFLASIAKV